MVLQFKTSVPNLLHSVMSCETDESQMIFGQLITKIFINTMNAAAVHGEQITGRA